MLSTSSGFPLLGRLGAWLWLFAALPTGSCASNQPGTSGSTGNAVRMAAQDPRGRAMTLSPEAVQELEWIAARAAGTGPPQSRAEHTVRWVHEHVQFTPDRHKTIDGVLEDRRGNCYDQAGLLAALLQANGFSTRLVREINVEPPSQQRASSAEKSKSHLFGYEHNDHTWLEIQIDGSWVPADSSLGLFGTREWIAARILRGVTNDYGMITPIAIVAYQDTQPVDRTRDYLEHTLAAEFPAVSKSLAWPTWLDDVAFFAPHSADWIAGSYDPAPDSTRIHRMGISAARLRRTLVDLGADAGVPSPLDVYLHPSEASGSQYCFDPDSPILRAALKRHFEENDLLDARGLAQDIDFLRDAMRKQYSGYPELLQSPTFDVERFFRDWIDDLRGGAASVTFRAGVLEPLVVLRGAIADFHLYPIAWHERLANDPRLAYFEYQAVLEGRAPNLKSCRATDESALVRSTLRVAPMLGGRGRKAQVITVSAHDLGDSVSLRCGARGLVLHRRELVKQADGIGQAPAYEEQRVGDAQVIVLRRFWGAPDVQGLLAQLAENYPRHERHKLLLFDLRGNTGGDDHFVRDWIARAKRGQWEDYVEVEIQGALVPCSEWNAVVSEQIRNERADTDQARAERSKLRARWSHVRPGVPRVDSGHATDKAKAPYQGAIIVLVDRRTASSGESAAWMLHQALGAMIIGERTGGFLQYTNVRPFVLPQTRVVCEFGTKRNYYAFPLEGIGLPVDAYLENAAAPVEEVLEALRSLGKGG